ncbi:MAG TPA: hypothetical protein VG826_28185 [Pirellulales bacterium]|nr:hypothetical protein [Pirellulales bacterium]
MNGPVTRLAILGLALSLALPAGWCCGSPEPPRKPTPAARGGCPHCQTQPQRSSAPSRDKSAPPCCCQRLATVNPIEKWQPDGPPVALVSILDLSSVRFDAVWPILSRTEQSASPPLQLLHCVWRC